MAFNRPNRTDNTDNTSWKASGFINFYLPSKDGKKRKLGSIALRDGKPNEKSLADWLGADPSRIQQVLASLVADFQPSTQGSGAEFDLSPKAAAQPSAE